MKYQKDLTEKVIAVFQRLEYFRCGTVNLHLLDVQVTETAPYLGDLSPTFPVPALHLHSPL